MAMTKCAECAHPISTLAQACPSCGAPTRAMQPKPASVAAQPQIRLPFKIALAGIGAIFLSAGVFGLLNPDRRPVAPAPLNVTVDELEAAYAQNTVAADARFKGRPLVVESVVQNINTDIGGGAYLVLGRQDQILAPQAGIAESDRGTAASLHPGSRVRLLCMGAGDIAKMPMLSDCHFQAEPTASIEPSQPQPQRVEPPDQATTDADRYFPGRTPAAMLNDPEMRPIFAKLLGDKYQEAVNRLDVSSNFRRKGDYYVGEGCAAHQCGQDEFVIAIRRSDSVSAAIMLKNGRDLDLFGVDGLNSLPPPLSAWMAEHHLVGPPASGATSGGA